jgi:hypothetical protein
MARPEMSSADGSGGSAAGRVSFVVSPSATTVARRSIRTANFARVAHDNPTINRPAKGDKIMSLINFVSGPRWLLCLAVLVVTARHLQAQVPADARKTLPSPAELTRLATIIKPSATANKWQQIPWLGDVNEGRKLAKEEKRPLFLWTVFGEPLDEC